MRIAILVEKFPPRWIAGTEIATYDLAKYLVRKGHEVHVITTLDEGLPRKSIEHNIIVYRIRRLRLKYLELVYYWLQMFFVLTKIRPDIVHCQNIITGVPGLIAKKILKVPFVIWAQGGDVYSPDLLWGQGSYIYSSFVKFLSILLLRDADVVIALTEDMKRVLQKTCNRDIVIIPNGIDLEKFNMLSKDMQESSQVDSKQKQIIFVGRFRPEKGLSYLVRAMKIIEQKDPSAKLILVGEGPEEDSLRQLVNQLDLNSVTFLGQIPNDRVPLYMAAADVFVLPSLWEGFPIVILEALASGLPIVASKTGGLPSFIKEGENGFFTEPKNVEQIAEKILLLLNDDELRKTISNNNMEKAKEYSWDVIVERLESVYQKLYVTKHPDHNQIRG